MKEFNFIIYALVVITTLNAQSDRVSGKIRGRVIDNVSKDPLAGANVLILPETRSDWAFNVVITTRA
jgi:hypothetical protein